MSGTIDAVREFWEKNPLWEGECTQAPGSREFFEMHRRVVVDDCYAGRFDERLLPLPDEWDHVLDLGCGTGFWTVELLLRGCPRVTAADLTERALELTRKRCDIYGVQAEFSRQNAERMTFEDGAFSHVNCQGVIHHTPDTQACVREIARVLRPGGTASVSVYYLNHILRQWRFLSWTGKFLGAMGGRLYGRGRDGLFYQDDVGELVRLYDGKDNPVGKCYSRERFLSMLLPYFQVKETFLHFFPARALPVRIPAPLHRALDRHVGFMIYAILAKR